MTQTSDTAKAMTATEKRNAALDKRIENILHDKLAHFLADIDFRIGQANAIVDRAGSGPRTGKVYAEDLNLLGRALLTGYTTTANSPAAGSFAWANLHVVYNGVDTTITDGNTNLKYVWWSSTTTPTTLQTSNTKPNLANGDVLLFVNNGGTPQIMLSDTNASMPGVLKDGAVDTGSILANAVTNAAIADGAVAANTIQANAITAVKIADGAVNRAGMLSGAVVAGGNIVANAVDATKIADGAIVRTGQLTGAVVAGTNIVANAVDSTKLADGAVVRTGQLGANVVGSTAIANGAITRNTQLAANVVTTTELADNAVDVAAIQANAVNSTKLADGAVVRTTQLSANVVTTNAIVANAVTSTELASNSVSATKLSILRHVLY